MISRVQFITQGDIEGKSHAQLAEQACVGGIDWIQVRVKDTEYQIWKDEAVAVQEVCRRYGASLIINDNPELVKEIGAKGVHLGKQDMPPQQARDFLGDSFIIGGTANELDDVKKLVEAKVDYIGLGPYRFTTTKKNLSPVLSADNYKEIFDYLNAVGSDIPVVSIGGIVPRDLLKIQDLGFHGVAIASVISKAENPVDVAKEFSMFY